jgi:hypothetical protein
VYLRVCFLEDEEEEEGEKVEGVMLREREEGVKRGVECEEVVMCVKEEEWMCMGGCDGRKEKRGDVVVKRERVDERIGR